MSDVGRYVYGVVPASSDAALPREQGIDPDYEVEVVARGALAAITSRVRVAQLSPERDEGLVDLALRHEHVLESFLVAGLSVLPFRFGTVCADDGEVTKLLEANEPALTSGLATVAGSLELGVRASVDRKETRQRALDADDDLRRRHAQLAELSPGAAHLRGLQLERILDERVSRTATEAAATLHDVLSGEARAARLGTGRSDVVLDAAYLVPVEAVDAFIERARTAAAELGLCIEVTGPWPPYSFVSAGADDAD